ncbi:hypothetical protein Xmau_04385 [Xenorhabdus mauleonii]|uniref:DUF1090 domain-containing protein n=1 Tax=Xenorhabdus mauleonii TaxID=351675 RepID=A0A1I3Y320_9GAMM|nr:DUF1090 family protein [Xenorhabdus mauleonii]PHM35984.1 hypothetical protein Xmau_04385 [Xenorhabdus mauleonii]SFK26143.1 Protein of unknown function [Xenorhabdus mauleonii]
MMSKTMILSALIVFSMSSAYASQNRAGCEIKKKALETQLEYAQTDKDKRLITGLTRTLENIKTTCDLEKRLQEQNNKSETTKNNVSGKLPPQKQKNSKKQTRKPTKKIGMNAGKKAQPKQK